MAVETGAEIGIVGISSSNGHQAGEIPTNGHRGAVGVRIEPLPRYPHLVIDEGNRSQFVEATKGLVHYEDAEEWIKRIFDGLSNEELTAFSRVFRGSEPLGVALGSLGKVIVTREKVVLMCSEEVRLEQPVESDPNTENEGLK